MDEREQIIKTIAALESQRSTLGDAVVETALTPLRSKLAALEVPLQAKRPLVTILNAALSHLPSQHRSVDATEAYPFPDALWAQLDQIIFLHGGSIESRLSNSIIAIWGLSQPQENAAVLAVRAALALQAQMLKLSEQENTPVTLRIGLNTGLVSLSQGSLTDKRNVVGETVDIASRLAEAAPPGNILISQATYDQVRGQFSVEIRPPLFAKEKTGPLQTYLVKSEKHRAFYMPVRGLAGITTRTIGREAEMNQIQAAYQNTIQEQSLHWVTVIGEAGLGKSRLLTEFEQWLELRPELIRYFKSRAWPHTGKTPYFLLRDLLAYRFQINDADDLELARTKLTAGLAEALGETLAGEAAAFLGQLVGFDFRHTPWIANIAENTRQIRGRAEVLLREYFAALSIRRPIVICLEDLHWADDESLEILSDLLQEPHPWRLCVLSMARPGFIERKPSWGKAPAGAPLAHHQLIHLLPLTGHSSYALAHELLQLVPLPPEWMVELLTERSAGNPYFMEELVHWLIEQDVIHTGPDLWEVTLPKPVGLSIPGTIQGVLQARLEHLSPALRSALQRAAVIGRVFWDDAVAYIGQQPVEADLWETLLKSDFIRAIPNSQLPGGKEYMFCQLMLRDVVYEYTLIKLRREYHRRAAEWLIKTAGSRSSEWASVIADHYQEAEEISLAAEWYRRAGEQAQATFAPDTAIQYFQKALNLVGGARELAADAAALRLEIYPALGEMLRWRARYEQAIQVFQAMLSTASAVEDRRKQAQAWLGLSQTQDSQGNYQAALMSAEQAERFAQTAGDPALAELAYALFRKGWAHYRLGNGEAALALGEQALALSAQLDDRFQMANSYNLLGGVFNLLGRFSEAMPHNQRALQLYRSLGDRERVASMLSNLGEHSRLSDDYRTAVQYYREALQMAQETANRTTEMVFNNNLGGALVGLGDYVEAEEHLRTTIQISELAKQSGWISETYRFLAQACLGQDHLDQARSAALKSLAIAQEVQAQEMIGAAWRVLGTVLARSPTPILVNNVPVDAVTCFTHSLRIFEQTGMQSERGRTLRTWGEYEVRQGDRQKGQELLQEAQQIFSDLGLTWRQEEEQP